MKASEAIRHLQQSIDEHGDIPVFYDRCRLIPMAESIAGFQISTVPQADDGTEMLKPIAVFRS
jgi:hypothetical protein